MPRSLISIGATWISLWSEHLKQKQIQVEKQPVTACCFITPENTRGKEGGRDAHLLEFNNTFVLQVCFIKHTQIHAHAHSSSSYTACKLMVVVTAGLYRWMFVCVCTGSEKERGASMCVFTPRLCVLSAYTLKNNTVEINRGGNELCLETIGQTSQPGYQGPRDSILPTAEKKNSKTHTNE